MELIEVVIETQGRVGFAAREVGRTVDTGEYILNTALHYAFGLASGRYVDVVDSPTYIEDTAEISEQVYIAPAEPLDSPDYMTTIYNARGDRYATVNYAATDDPDQDKNLPRFGRERAFTQGNHFRTYLVPYERDAASVAAELPQYVRLGKKRGKVKLHVRRVKARREAGRFVSTHPIGTYDYDGKPLGSVISRNMRPMSLILQAEYEDEHFVVPQGDGETPVKLPANLQFLGTKR